ncbi:MAG: TonB-dependent receptor [Candidatus Eremiobacteraeota bacterium]|nr:TonB-dependent receptor [Candidatus Eremiobacteraeota bacterium]
MGEITITVIDVVTGRPVANARTFLIGPTVASSLTTAAGVIKYTDAPTGIYRVRVTKQGYNSGISREFDVLNGRSMEVRVELALNTGGLKVIGSITATTNVQITSKDISDSSAVRRLSDSLTDALDKIAGVSVTQDSSDPNSALTVSLRGHDESQTAATLDGIPLAAAGNAANLRQIGTDLFSGSSVSFGATAGSLGGGVNFRTLQPTQALQGKMSGTIGSFDRANYATALTGSIGSLGLAVQHTWRGSNNPLTFQTFQDLSGKTYAHEGESNGLGDFIKLRYRLGDSRTTVSATALSNNNDSHNLCTQFVTLFPCGSGPNNFNFGRYGFAYGTVQSLVGQIATTISGYTNSSIQNSDFNNRYIDNVPVPSASTTQSTTRGAAYSFSIAEGHHTIALSGNTYASINSSIPKAGSRFEVPFTIAVSSTSYQIADSIKSSDKLTLSPRLSIASTTGGVGTSALGGFGATWRPRSADTYDASFSFGSSQPGSSVVRSFSDPRSARANCAAGTAIVSGPGDSAGKQSAFNFNVAWTHAFSNGASFSADAYSQVQSGQLIQALINETGNPAYFPTVPGGTIGYVQQAINAYHQSTVCGLSVPNPTLYVSEPVGGTRRIYQGMDFSGRIGLGRNVVVLPNYSINVAKLTAASARLLDGPSTTIVGAQLPGRPVHRGGITIDGLVPAIKTELLMNAQYTGPNNFQNLGPYVTLSAGISHDVGPGRLTIFENNIFNTYQSLFATDALSRPLPLSNGGQYTTAAFPLTPRTISMSYTVNVGGPRPPASIGNAVAAAASRAAAQAAAGQGPNNQIRFTPVPPPAGTDPLALATTRTSCDAESQTAAKPVLELIKSYVTAYEAKATVPKTDAFDVTPHAATADPTVPYYLEIRWKLPSFAGAGDAGAGGARRTGGAGGGGGLGGPGGGGPGGPGGPEGGGPIVVVGGAQGAADPAIAAARQRFLNSPEFKVIRGMTACTYVTVLTSAEAKAKGLVVQFGAPRPAGQGQPGAPTTGGAQGGGQQGGNRGPSLYYVPGIGLVSVRPPELPQGGGSLKAGS